MKRTICKAAYIMHKKIVVFQQFQQIQEDTEALIPAEEIPELMENPQSYSDDIEDDEYVDPSQLQKKRYTFCNESWYFKNLSRDQANKMLMTANQNGTYLIRDSSTRLGDYVLSVREFTRVFHYIIKRVADNNGICFRISEKTFNNINSLLEYYKNHTLNTTRLAKCFEQIVPPIEIIGTVITKYDFPGRDEDDLPFTKGEILEVVHKDEKEWWTARNKNGKMGSVPVTYVTKMERKLPARAKVRQSRVPNAYDKSALKLKRGELIDVTATNMNGVWEGVTLDGRRGHFPFKHVEFIDDIVESSDNSD